jgi:hypothetical protein
MSSATPHRIDPPITALPQIGGPHTHGHQRPLTPVKESAASGDQREASGKESAEEGALIEPRRVDTPHAAIHGTGTNDGPRKSAGAAALPTPDEWLRLHAGELVDRLQAWASDLDSREAQLNARTSLQDHRERRFRLQQQDAATELAEQQRSIERLRREIEAQARRLAFQEDLGSE